MKILICGLGSIGRKHVAAINHIMPEALIYAIRSQKNAEAIPGVINVYSFEEVPQNIDFAIISNITSLHESTICELLPLGCPLFIEKPVLSNLVKADQLLQLIQKEEIITYVACNLRFHPSIRFIKEYVDAYKPRINEISVYAGSYLPEWRPNIDFRSSYSANPNMGGGVHLDLIHELDYCTWIFGFPQMVSSFKQSLSSLEIDSIDSARFIFQYENYLMDIALNYFRRDTKRTIEIVTDENTIVVDLIKNEVIKLGNNEVIFKNECGIGDTYYEQMRYFIDRVLTSQTTMNDFENALNVLKIATNEQV